MAMNSATAGPGLCDLPLETLQDIAGYLANTCRPSLYAFSLTNKACHQASTFFTFHKISLTIRSREKLLHDVDNLVKTLSRTDSTRHVHSISLQGFLDLKKPRKERGIVNIDPLSWWNNRRVNEIFPDEEPIPYGEYFVYDESVIKEDSEEDLAWAPLADFIRILPSLGKLVYNCPNQFPPCLLSILHKHHPQCKLHHLTFRLRTLLWETPYPYEMALATSPCLYSIKVICTYRDSEGDNDYNQEATKELVAGLAPNLKEVTVINISPYRARKFTRERDQWQGFPGFVSGMVGSLTSLSLVGSSEFYWPPEYVKTWSKYTDFGSLCHLTIGEPGHKAIDGEMMCTIAQNHSFPQLKALAVSLERNDASVEKPDYGDNAAAFFTAFKPLEELSVFGPLEPKILDAILHRHGRTLQKLVLRPYEDEFLGNAGRVRKEIPMRFTKEHILQIHTECPALEDLTIPVKRMKSSAAEVEIYRSFSKMENLRSLFLSLDCSEWRVRRDSAYDPPFDELDREIGDYNYQQGHLREALMNCAVDEALARSIWETIRKESKSKHLETLKLWTTGAGQFGNGQSNIAEDLFSNMSRSWLIELVPRDDKETIKIKELGQSAREVKDAYRKTVGPMGPRPKEMEVFRRLWPSKEGSKSWYDDWSGIPLEV